MNRQVCVVFVLFFLLVFAVSSLIVRGASQVELTPTSGEPGDSVHIEGSDFAASKAVGIGLGPEVKVINEEVTITDTDVENIHTFSGFTANHPIKPGSFKWDVNQAGFHTVYADNGNGTISPPGGGLYMLSSVINYTTGFFSRTMSTVVDFEYFEDTVNYTTYWFDVTPDGLGTDGSGVLSGNFTVPDIWNGTEPLTVIDEAGNMATADFTTYGSDTIPEPFTVGALILLTSTAIVVSFYWLKKKPTNKIAKYG